MEGPYISWFGILSGLIKGGTDPREAEELVFKWQYELYKAGLAFNDFNDPIPEQGGPTEEAGDGQKEGDGAVPHVDGDEEQDRRNGRPTQGSRRLSPRENLYERSFPKRDGAKGL